MSNYKKSIVPQIEAIYASLSPTEKNIADFFIHNHQCMDFSAKNISVRLTRIRVGLKKYLIEKGVFI